MLKDAVDIEEGHLHPACKGAKVKNATSCSCGYS